MKDSKTKELVTSPPVIEEAKTIAVNQVLDAIGEDFSYDEVVDILHRVKSRLEKIYGRRFS